MAKARTPEEKQNHEQALWKAYHEGRSDAARNALIEFHLPAVKHIAARMAQTNPFVDVEDMESVGCLGLMDAVKAFDPERGVKFTTYCVPRIRGAILDEIRTNDWVPRLVRSQSTKLRNAVEEMRVLSGQEPTYQELADHLNVKIEELEEFLQSSNCPMFISLERKFYETDSFKDVCEKNILADDKGVDPQASLDSAEALREVTRGLNKRDRLMIIGYFYEGQTMKEIGAQLDLSESRISQRMGVLLADIKERLRGSQREFGIRSADCVKPSKMSMIRKRLSPRKRAA